MRVLYGRAPTRFYRRAHANRGMVRVARMRQAAQVERDPNVKKAILRGVIAMLTSPVKRYRMQRARSATNNA